MTTLKGSHGLFARVRPLRGRFREEGAGPGALPPAFLCGPFRAKNLGSDWKLVLIAAFGILLVSVRLHAQGEGAIHGRVLAQADRSALPNATVRLEGLTVGSSLTTVTGPDGHFGFQRLVPGEYTVAATRPDFVEERIRFTLKPREVRTITLELALTPVRETVTVEVSPEDAVTTYSPSSTVIQSRTLAELPLAQRNNLSDVIVTAAPGMIRGHDDFVHIRGHEVALNPFLNGVSFWENPHAVFSAGLGADYIQSVNVMTGGFSAEYGNRFGGVLDVVTKSGF